MKKQVTVEFDVTLADVLEDKTMDEIVQEISEYEKWIADWNFTLHLLNAIFDGLDFKSFWLYGQGPSKRPELLKLKSYMKNAVNQIETGEDL